MRRLARIGVTQLRACCLCSRRERSGRFVQLVYLVHNYTLEVNDVVVPAQVRLRCRRGCFVPRPVGRCFNPREKVPRGAALTIVA
jgi:hypothetical protein